METIDIRTRSRTEFVDITSRVAEITARSGVTEGLAVVYVPHTTAGVTINEAADPSVQEDVRNKFSEFVPHTGQYRHAEGNSDAHIKTTMVGSSAHLIISRGSLVLGVWQGIFFCEFDGPRSRKVHIQIISQ